MARKSKKNNYEHVKYNQELRDSVYDCLIDYGKTIINIKKYNRLGKTKLINMIEGFKAGNYILTNVKIEKKLCPLDKKGSRRTEYNDEDYLVVVTAKAVKIEE